MGFEYSANISESFSPRAVADVARRLVSVGTGDVVEVTHDTIRLRPPGSPPDRWLSEVVFSPARVYLLTYGNRDERARLTERLSDVLREFQSECRPEEL